MINIDELKKEIKEQDAIVDILRKRERMFKEIPQGLLRVAKEKNQFQYYFKREGSDRYDYVPVSQRDKVKGLAQREFEKKLLKKLENNKKTVERFIRDYRHNLVNDEYEKLPEGRKKIIDPVIKTDAMFIKEWYRKHPGGMNPFPEKGRYTTDRGEEVRSKSEKIIADLFNKEGIPYQYEAVIMLQRNVAVYPDFLLLNIRERKTFIWEHLGLVDDKEYATKNLKKIYEYERSGYHLGTNLIISVESEEYPLDLNSIKAKIEMYLK